MLHPRARTMLLLSLPAVAIGIASSLILIVVMKIASVLQNLLWQRLPGTLGIAQDSPLWIIGVLTLTGIAVGLVIRFSQGHAGPDPACEPLIGAPVPPSASALWSLNMPAATASASAFFCASLTSMEKVVSAVS